MTVKEGIDDDDVYDDDHEDHDKGSDELISWVRFKKRKILVSCRIGTESYYLTEKLGFGTMNDTDIC